MAHARLAGVIQHLRTALASRTSAGVPDARLLERFLRRQDEAAFELLVWRHGKMVLGTCLRLLHDAHEAEDAFQACFLALARRAGSIGRRESVGGWLHKVAYRLALGARARQARRGARERPLDDGAAVAGPADPAAEAARREVRRVLDEELSRLPDRYRVPFVLCHLEGLSNADAARELGCALGTVESRLTRARKLLRTRLSHKGVALSAGPAACVPAVLAASTARAATFVAAGHATAAGLISTRVAAMTEGVLRAMFMTKLKTAAAILLAVALSGTGIGVVAYGTPAAEQPSTGPGAVQDKSRAAGDTARIARLIEQLGSETFDERERATKELDEIGAPALEALRKAARDDDPERTKRADELVRKIERRLETARLLAPKRVHLVYKDTPLADAVAEFRRQSGYDLTLFDADGKLKDHKITLDTGEVTFWQAFDQFRQKAGLVEATRPAAPWPARRAGGGAGGPGGAGDGPPGAPGAPGGGRLPGGMGRAMRGPPRPPVWLARRIALTEGQPAPLPTDDRTAVCVRMVSADMRGAPADEEIWLVLETTPEPRFRWKETLDIRVTKATDDLGQSLEQVLTGGTTPPGPRDAGPGGAAGGGGRFDSFRAGQPITVTPVRLKKGARASTSLKDTSGTITARVRGEGQPVITVADVLKSAGKTFKGAQSGSIKVLDVAVPKEGGTPFKVHFELDPPAELGMAEGVFRMESNPETDMMLSRTDEASPDSPGFEFEMVDDNGNWLPPTAGMEYRMTAAKTLEFTLVFQPQKGQGQPAKLALSVSKCVTINVPFTLKNVPLSSGAPARR